jgi:hypothetical protein
MPQEPRSEVQTMNETSEAATTPQEASSEADRHACQRRGCETVLRQKRDHGEFCSDYCRLWANRHPEDDLRRKRPCIVRRNTQGPSLKRHKRSALAILGRLQQGPATAWELIRAGGGTRFGARIFELRHAHGEGETGHDIRVIAEDDASGATRYALFVGGVVVGPGGAGEEVKSAEASPGAEP